MTAHTENSRIPRRAGLAIRRWVPAVLALLLPLAPAAGTAVAQQPAAPLPLTVRPSGTDPVEAEARARQERLLKRMQENEYLFRNICVQCGGGVNKPGAYAPFHPIDVLGRRGTGDEG
jgi:hypothetical protein